jgi:hypothetical protein
LADIDLLRNLVTFCQAVVSLANFMATGDLPLLEPLCFKSSTTTASHRNDPEDSFTVLCMLCSETFSLLKGMDDLSKHLLVEHKLTIDDLQNITDLPRYMLYWKGRLEAGLHQENIHSIFETNSKDVSQMSSFRLSDSIPEDRDLRLRLQEEKLLEVLDQQQKERDDVNFCRSCLFCARQFTGNRSKLFSHMAEFHNFDLGDANNLVYTCQLLRLLEEKLHNLQCLYCEKTFKDALVLKEHMRKKRHKRLRINSPTYQWFFMSSYLGKKDYDAVADSEEDDDEEVEDADNDEKASPSREHEWNDWVETEGCDAVCLFCHQTSTDTELLLQHLKNTHGFELQQLISDHKLSFYQQVKLINFMRRQLHYNTCTYCDTKFDNFEALSHHLRTTVHSTLLPPVCAWNQPQYYFPTYENDSLLCSLMDNDGDTQCSEVSSEMTQVVAEDMPSCINSLTLQQSDRAGEMQTS